MIYEGILVCFPSLSFAGPCPWLPEVLLVPPRENFTFDAAFCLPGDDAVTLQSVSLDR